MRKIILPEKLYAKDTFIFTKGDRDVNKFSIDKTVDKVDCEVEFVIKLPNKKYYNLKGEEVVITKENEKYLHKATEGVYNFPGSFFDDEMRRITYIKSKKDSSLYDDEITNSKMVARIHYYLTEAEKEIWLDDYWYKRENNVDYSSKYELIPVFSSIARQRELDYHKIDVSTLGTYDGYYEKQELLLVDKFLKEYSKEFCKKHQKDAFDKFYKEKKDLTKQLKEKAEQYNKEKKLGYDVSALNNEIIDLKKEYNDLMLKGEQLFKKPTKSKLLTVSGEKIVICKEDQENKKLDESLSTAISSIYNDIINNKEM